GVGRHALSRELLDGARGVLPVAEGSRHGRRLPGARRAVSVPGPHSTHVRPRVRVVAWTTLLRTRSHARGPASRRRPRRRCTVRSIETIIRPARLPARTAAGAP